ncbi:MAG: BCCT family transporter, partial [Flavobacteriales bacterium]|nr:BCCT family transporter [Flavobacteriales bacterium]
MKKLRGSVFYPSFLLLTAAVGAAVYFEDRFLSSLSSANAFLLSKTGPGIQTAVLLMVITCAAVPFTPLGRLKIGGAEAVPFLSKTKWFAIVLCTTVATGILFWATAEPIFHFAEPPENSGIEPESADAAQFSLATLFLHWSFSPYAIYTVPALVFAVGYYNKKKAYSVGSALFSLPFAGGRKSGIGLDNLSLFALVMGMAASLGAGILTLKGGLDRSFDTGMHDTAVSGLIALSIVAAFTISASTGLMKGIKNLSLLNFYIFIALMIFIVLTGFPSA